MNSKRALIILALLGAVAPACSTDDEPDSGPVDGSDGVPDASGQTSRDDASPGGPSDGVCGEPDELVWLTYNSPMDFEGCVRFRGSLHIPDDQNGAALEKLRPLRRIDGGLSVFRNVGLVDLRALEALEVVGGEFWIRFNGMGDEGQFVSLTGLESLTEVGGLMLEMNPGLRDISALANLKTIHGDLRVTNNPSLPQAQIEALLARVEVKGTVTIEDNGP